MSTATLDFSVMRVSPALQQVLDFWFLAENQAEYGERRMEWFTKDLNFDAAIRQQFGTLIEQALTGDVPSKEVLEALSHRVPAATRSVLACIILLDQFTRNTYRGTPKAFAGDSRALALAQAMVQTGAEKQLLPVQRCFVYLPFEHAEDWNLQQQSVDLYTQLQQEVGGCESELDYAIRHRDIIAQFGRFPHRNAILGRSSRPEEAEFLTLPGSSF